ncbi:MAG: hypothetical protein ACXW2P_07795 [Thermoanaerobaculia bacterium]
MSGCSHKNPPEIIAEAEVWLREKGITPDRWSGLKVRHAESTPGTMWESVVVEIERRGGDWIVTKLNRNKTPLEEAEGLKLVR